MESGWVQRWERKEMSPLAVNCKQAPSVPGCKG